jgi:hypothetical protein
VYCNPLEAGATQYTDIDAGLIGYVSFSGYRRRIIVFVMTTPLLGNRKALFGGPMARLFAGKVLDCVTHAAGF